MSHNFLLFVFGGISSGMAGLCLLLKWYVDERRPYDLAWAIAILSYSVGVVLAAGLYDRQSVTAGVGAVVVFWIFAAGMVIGNLSFAARRIPFGAIAAAFAVIMVLSFVLGLHRPGGLAVFTTCAAAIFLWTGWELRKLPAIGTLAMAVFFLRAAFLVTRPLLPDSIDRAPLALTSNVITMATGLVLLFGSVLRSRDLLRQHEAALAEANRALQAHAGDLRQQNHATQQALHRAEAAVAAKRNFIANISHELRTPLTAVIGFTELIQHRPGGADLADIKEYAACANQGGADMLRKVDRILEYVEIDDHQAPATAPFDPADAVRREVALHRAGLEEKALSLNLDLGTAPPPRPLKGNERLFRLIVRELLSNAIKAAPPRSSIAVGVEPQGDLLRLCIADAGPGMPASFISTIGESFNVEGSAFDRGGDAQGLGLGLSLVTRYAQQVNAVLSFAPNMPTGTVALVDFPYEAGLEGRRSAGDGDAATPQAAAGTERRTAAA
jgi:signal transduction histidine kinase